MAFHDVSTVPRRDFLEVGDFTLELTRKDHAHERDGFAVACIAAELGSDEVFLTLAREVRDDRAKAPQLARRYARSGVQRLVLELVLLEASSVPEPDVRTHLANLGSTGVWSGADLEAGDARYTSQRAKLDALRAGAVIVARRGAGLCLRCGEPPRREDRYCKSCSPKRQSEVRGDAELARELLRAVAEHLGIESSGPRRRRVQMMSSPRSS